MDVISGELYHGQMMRLYRTAGVIEVLRLLSVPDEWPLSPEEIERAVGTHEIGTENCIDAVTTAQVAKIAGLIGLPPLDSRLMALRAVFRTKLAVDR